MPKRKRNLHLIESQNRLLNDIRMLDVIQYLLYRDANNLIIAPHKSLRPYISNYTFTKPKSMPKEQTILPSVSNTLVYSIGMQF